MAENALPDTIIATEIYLNNDTLFVATDGLDSIIYTQVDTTGYYIGIGNFATFYVGEADSLAFQQIIGDTTLNVLLNDSIAYYISNESGAYIIPAGEQTAYALTLMDSLVYGKTNSGVDIVEINVNLNPAYVLVNLGHTTKSVNQGLYGIHIGGMFDAKTAPNEPESMYAWQWLVDLAPEVLRFPQGSGSKFMHLLHYSDGSDVTGYGYDIIEIARYFDYIDGVLEYDYSDLSPSDIAEIESTISPSWISDEYWPDFNKLHEQWEGQQCEDVNTKYIDDFIELVQMIDAAYPGRPSTKVILTLNVISESATECRAIADYLRAAGVNVVGIELGNECYGNFYCDVMNFTSFNQYWNFINGTNLAGHSNILYEDPNPAVHTDMFEDHDFITAFKTPSPLNNFNYKIGIVGQPLDEDNVVFNTTDDVLIGERSGCNTSMDWNTALYDEYDEKIADGSKYKFDAVIMHTYYTSEHWRDIVLSNFTPITECSGTADLWKYDVYDSRLQATFNGIMGVDGISGNFKDFIMNGKDEYHGFAQGFDKINDYFHFTDEELDPKDLWVTEWNLKDNYLDGNDLQVQECEIFSNTLAHAYLYFHWWLKEIKVNYDPDYRNNFFTYSTVQNYINGTSINLVSIADDQEEDFYNKTGFGGADCTKRNYHLRRTTYFTTYLLSEIFKENLKYLKSSNVLPFIPNNSGNIQPTIFIDQEDQYLYVYYSNMTNDYYNIRLFQGSLKSLYPDATDIVFDDEGTTNVYIQGSQYYSSSGKVTLNKFDNDWSTGDPISDYEGLNDCYQTFDHAMELVPTTEAGLFPVIHNSGNYPQCAEGTYETLHNCLTADPYSIGYFKVHFTPMYPLRKEIYTGRNQLMIFPNPTSTRIQFACGDKNQSNSRVYEICIYSMEGALLMKTSGKNYEEVDVSGFESGIYLLEVLDAEGVRYFGNFIKSD